MAKRSLTGYDPGPVQWRTPATAWHAVWTGAANAVALPVGAQQFWPFVLPDSLITKSARLEVTVAAATAGSVVRVGVYLPDTVTGLPVPASRIDFGSADSTIIGVKDVLTAANFTLPRNALLWLSLLALTSNCTIRTLGQPGMLFPIPAAAALGTGAISGLSLAAQADLTITTAPNTLSTLGAPRAFLRNDTV